MKHLLFTLMAVLILHTAIYAQNDTNIIRYFGNGIYETEQTDASMVRKKGMALNLGFNGGITASLGYQASSYLQFCIGGGLAAMLEEGTLKIDAWCPFIPINIRTYFMKSNWTPILDIGFATIFYESLIFQRYSLQGGVSYKNIDLAVGVQAISVYGNVNLSPILMLTYKKSL